MGLDAAADSPGQRFSEFGSIGVRGVLKEFRLADVVMQVEALMDDRRMRCIENDVTIDDMTRAAQLATVDWYARLGGIQQSLSGLMLALSDCLIKRPQYRVAVPLERHER